MVTALKHGAGGVSMMPIIFTAANIPRTYDMTYMGDTLGGFAHKTDNWEVTYLNLIMAYAHHWRSCNQGQ